LHFTLKEKAEIKSDKKQDKEEEIEEAKKNYIKGIFSDMQLKLEKSKWLKNLKQ